MGQFTPSVSRRTVLSRTISGLVGYGVLTERLAHGTHETVQAQAVTADGGWPQYKADAGHSGRVKEGVGPTGNIKEVTLDAFEDLSDYIDEGMAVVDETVYIGSRDLVAINTATGQLRWRFEPTVPDHDYPAPGVGADVGHPAVVDGTAYASVAFAGPGSRPTTYDSALIAVDATTGEQRWRYDTPGGVTYDEFTIVTVTADTIVASLSKSNQDTTRTVIALTTDGTERWRTQIDEMAVGALPVSDGTVYIPSATGIQALDVVTGETVWTTLPNVRFGPGAASLVADGTLFVAEEAEPGLTLIALDASTGEEAWRTSYTPEGSSLGITIGTADERRVYIDVDGIENTIIALDRADGSECWRTPLDNTGNTTIPRGFALVGGVLYKGATQGVSALDPSDGSIIWTHTLPAVGSGWQIGAIAGGRVYLGGTQLAVLTGTTN